MEELEISQKKCVYDKLNKYTYSNSENDFIEVTEWTNGEGYDIQITTEHGEKQISLSFQMLILNVKL